MPEILYCENGRGFIDHRPYLPLVLPSTWRVVQEMENGRAYTAGNLKIFASAAIERDGRPWLHLSISRRDMTVPQWDDLLLVRSVLAPKDAHGYVCLPPEDEYCHFPPKPYPMIHVLHIFYSLSGRILPDFRPDPEVNQI